MAFLQSREVRDLQANVTRIYDDFVVEAEKIMGNSEQIESELKAMVKEFVNVGFFRSTNDEGPNTVVYRWQGDVKTLLNGFVDDLYNLGEDPATNTLSIYGLAEKLGNDIMDLVNINLDKMAGVNYTVDDAKQALFEAVRAENDEFNRDVIIREMSKMINGVTELYGYEEGVNATQALTDAINWVEHKLRDYSDESIQRIPGRVFVTPMIVLDYVLGLVRFFARGADVGRFLGF